MSLSILSILLGICFAVPAVCGLLWTDGFKESMRQFPRSGTWGNVLIGISTLWFLYLVQQEDISDFAAYKTIMIWGFAGIGLGTALYVKDLLAIRGAAVFMLLLAKLMVETARWVDTPWRLVIVVWAYALVIAGMWFTISPWRMRDLIHWAVKDTKRLKILCSFRIAFCSLVVLLGLTVFRTAPQL